jgi:hypothetical protein
MVPIPNRNRTVKLCAHIFKRQGFSQVEQISLGIQYLRRVQAGGDCIPSKGLGVFTCTTPPKTERAGCHTRFRYMAMGTLPRSRQARLPGSSTK